jgi:hypothetical protein
MRAPRIDLEMVAIAFGFLVIAFQLWTVWGDYAAAN